MARRTKRERHSIPNIGFFPPCFEPRDSGMSANPEKSGDTTPTEEGGRADEFGMTPFQMRVIREIRSADPPNLEETCRGSEENVKDDPFKHLGKPRTSCFDPPCDRVNEIPDFLRGLE